MKNEDLFTAINNIDEQYIEAAHAPGSGRKSWRKWVAAAACFCVIIAGAAVLSLSGTDSPAPSVGNTDDLPAAAIGFALERQEYSVVYFPISFEQRQIYGLVDAGDAGLNADNQYRITEQDLGEFMGTVPDALPAPLAGASVYHFSAYPTYDSICIVDFGGSYAFYTADWIELPDNIGQSSNIPIVAYGLPDSVQKIEVLTSDWTPLYEITDKTMISALVSQLSGKENIGLQNHERLFAQVWYDAYGNKDVYYSEVDGFCQFTGTDRSLYDAAHALWTQGERVLQIRTDRGFSLWIDYFPATGSFTWGNGYYTLTQEEVQQLNTLLEITE